MATTIIDTYARSPEGDIFIADGLNPVKRWDGLLAAPEDAGLVGPETAPTIEGGTGIGQILGEYAAYVRYQDLQGNYSNLSPVSAVVSLLGTGGSITGATNTGPIRITTSGAHGLTDGDIVRIEGTTGNTGCIATWEVTVISSTEFDLDGSYGDGDYTGGGTWTPGIDEVIYSDIPVPTNSKVVRKQILRNTDGQFTTFYVDVDTDDLAETDFTSTRGDEELFSQEAQALLTTDGAELANANYPPPDFMTTFAPHSGRMFAAVNRIYKEGAVVVTNASATVTGIGTKFTAVMVGRFLFVNGATQHYEIESVDVTAQTLTLTEVYGDTTNPFAAYAIRPELAQRRLVWYTQAGKSQSWSPLYALEVQEDDDELTGLMQKGSFIYFLEERHIHRFTFQSDPAVDGFVYQSCQRGVINNRSWVQVEDKTYMLDRAGIHGFSGGQESEQLSSGIQRIFQTLAESNYVINWDARDTFHAAHSPQEEVVRWFVSMGSGGFPRHAIAMAYRTKRWWLEEYPVPITASALGFVGLKPIVWLGSEGLNTFAAAIGYLDGIDKNSGTLYGTVTAADFCSITDGSATFPAAVVGLTLSITSGKGKLQQRIIHDVDGTRLKVMQPWRIVPDETSRYQIGGIKYEYLSRAFTWAEGETNMRRKIGVYFVPSESFCDAFFRVYRDEDLQPVVWRTDTFGNPEGMSAEDGQTELRLDMTRESGYAQQRMENNKDKDIDGERGFYFAFAGVSGQDGATVISFELDGVQGE